MHIVRSSIYYFCIFLIFIFIGVANAQENTKLSIAVTLPDLVPVVTTIAGDMANVEGIMAPGADPHSYSLTPENYDAVRKADLVVFADSEFLSLEGDLAKAIENDAIPKVDWPDYQAFGAKIKDFPPRYNGNPHGFWLGFDNIRAIAKGIKDALVKKGLDNTKCENNLNIFLDEIDNLEASGKELLDSKGYSESKWIAIIPGVVYSIDNLGLTTADVLLEEGVGFASGGRLKNIEMKLVNGEYTGLVCPLSMKDAKPGEIAKQVAGDTGVPIAYVKFLDSKAGESYLSQAAYNLAAISSAASSRIVTREEKAKSNSQSYIYVLIYWLVIFALLIIIVILNSKLYLHAKEPIRGSGIFEKKGKAPKPGRKK
ncbi:MAG: zinc ABC transporter substrate-binding protein [bacterium]